MNPLRHVLLGLFFFGCVIALGTVTIYLGDWNPFAPRKLMQVYFSEVGGLRSGDPVLVFGMPLGRVLEIRFTEEAEAADRLVVELATGSPARLSFRVHHC